MNANDYINTKNRKTVKTLNKFAPEKAFQTTNAPNFASWIKNEIKKVFLSRDKLFQKWTTEPTKKTNIDIN